MQVSMSRLFHRDLEHMMTVIDGMGQGLDELAYQFRARTMEEWTDVGLGSNLRACLCRAVETCEDLYDELRLARDLVTELANEQTNEFANEITSEDTNERVNGATNHNANK